MYGGLFVVREGRFARVAGDASFERLGVPALGWGCDWEKWRQEEDILPLMFAAAESRPKQSEPCSPIPSSPSASSSFDTKQMGSSDMPNPFYRVAAQEYQHDAAMAAENRCACTDCVSHLISRRTHRVHGMRRRDRYSDDTKSFSPRYPPTSSYSSRPYQKTFFSPLSRHTWMSDFSMGSPPRSESMNSSRSSWETVPNSPTSFTTGDNVCWFSPRSAQTFYTSNFHSQWNDLMHPPGSYYLDYPMPQSQLSSLTSPSPTVSMSACSCAPGFHSAFCSPGARHRTSPRTSLDYQPHSNYYHSPSPWAGSVTPPFQSIPGNTLLPTTWSSTDLGWCQDGWSASGSMYFPSQPAWELRRTTMMPSIEETLGANPVSWSHW